ncbi:hypothetical protein GLOIN_2v1789992 [Rhizophagus irregularis DAOM 181602=DAOM 197198]|uniref:Uncharacterized protein n=2 Tax=Rhizophagus irregularis (strain DAOM 181602 / DAOM 197198 / MUCL 43194) TaxID=747089 RepID=A0A2P4NZZ6_RHIID|nr:hypothetical protein GLOIN_2v1789992 [Rhizophagus irregularis DAOM 181602=DAOM 197198]POG58716.1 hypothetical protein GLOIN_2v1789992 [Rhizophagus irregularis DAOM 181602=DAOM 197198]|eukprot:XP_025165582.1 hypothetical protein GLOIN_2v1789992 [Rhizophagus irregularis DAOM 181602=DAOM 197198]
MTAFAQELKLHIISIGSDGAQVEFNAQTQVQQISTPSRLRISYAPYNIDFNCPIFPNVRPVIRIQDPKHAKKMGHNAAMSGARVLTLNRSTVGFGHFAKLLIHSESPMYKSDIYKLDRQDDGAAYQIFCPKNLMCCLDSNNEIKPEFEGTFIYLFIIGELVDSYLNRNITPIERIRMCEHFFDAARQINVDFDFTELLEMVLKIGHYTKALNSKEISFNKDKSVCEGYQFEYNQNFIENDQINLLRTWPDDDQIHRIFDQSRQIACNIAEYLGMLTLDIVPINSFWPYVLITSNDMEISGSNDENMQDSENSNKNLLNSSLSQVISHAVKEVDLLRQRENERNEMNIDEENRNSSLNECRKQLSFIDLEETENTISTDFDDMIFVTKNRIDFQEMIYRREKHNAYTSRNIERTIKTNNTRIINSTSINPNQANHIVSFFTKNENAEMRQSIANFYEKEQSNKRQKILSSNRNLIKNIEFANINQDNPLNEQDYVIAYYGIQLCIGQVISSFYEAYRYHFYNQEPITDIENISYLTLKVFTPIRNIFSAEIEGGHILITHQCPKNVLYHLDMQDIQIFDNTLQLLDKAKACYNFFKKEEIICIITQN